MKTCYSETCMRLDCRNCQYKSNLEIENQNAEQAIASIYKTFCLFCLILIAITLI